MLIDEYLVKFGVVGDAAKAESFRGQIVSIGAAATAAVAAVTAAVGMLTGYFARAIGELDDLGTMAQNTGTSVAFIQEIGYVAEQTGSSVDAARSSVQGLSRVMGEAANGVGRGAKTFERFGLTVRNADGSLKDMGEVIGDIQQRMAGMSAQQQTAFLSRLGIDPSMRQSLNLTVDAFTALVDQAREWGVNTDEQAEAASTFQNRIKDLRFGLHQLRTSIGLALLPTLDELIAKFKDWFRENRELVQNGLQRLFTVIRYVLQITSNWFGFISRLIEGTIGWRNAILLLAAAFAIMNRALLANPFTWILVGLAAVLLLIDDLMTYLQGGESLFGDYWQPLIDGAQELWGYVSELWDLFTEFLTEIGPLLEFVGDQFGSVFVAAAEIAMAALNGAFELIKAGLELLAAIASGDMERFKQAFVDAFNAIQRVADAVFGSIAKLIDNTLGRAVGFVGGLIRGEGLTGALAAARGAVANANTTVETPTTLQNRTNAILSGDGPPSSVAAAARGATNSSTTNTNATTVNQKVDISISGPNPDVAARETARALTGAARNATANMAPTVVQ